MSRRGRQRGAALAWAVALSTLLSLAVAGIAGDLARQAGSVRRLHADGAREDLLRAGRAWASAGGLGTLELAAGRVEVRRGAEGALELVVILRGSSPETPVPIGS